ncbi:MAG: type II secretion system F family protein [Chloroflexota bacterium]|nr:type II secretion system F family protein [Chloroflexota bacterium]
MKLGISERLSSLKQSAVWKNTSSKVSNLLHKLPLIGKKGGSSSSYAMVGNEVVRDGSDVQPYAESSNRASNARSKPKTNIKDSLSNIKGKLPLYYKMTLKSGRYLILSFPSIWERIVSLVKRVPELPKAILAGVKKSPSLLKAIAAGVGAFFGKILSPAELRERIAQLRQKGFAEITSDMGKRMSRLGTSIKGLTPVELEIGLVNESVILINEEQMSHLNTRFEVAMAKSFPGMFGVKRADVINFTHNLSVLLESGVPLLFALEILQRQIKGAAFRRTLEEMMEDLEQGSTFSEACAKHPGVFQPFYVRLIKVGEEAGNLETVLESLVKQMKKDDAQAAKLKGGMTYPIVVLCIGLGVVVMLALFVLPTMESLYTSTGGEPPAMLTTTVGAGEFMKQNIIIILVSAIAAGVALQMFTTKTASGRKIKDTILMKMPVLGPVVLQGRMSRLCNNMAILLKAGVSLTDGLRLMIQASDSVLIQEALVEVDGEIHSGASLSDSMKAQPLFPGMMTQMVEVGEMTGRLEMNLVLVADYYETEADRASSRLITMMGPLMMVIVGGMVGVVAMSMFSSIFGMYDSFG